MYWLLSVGPFVVFPAGAFAGESSPAQSTPNIIIMMADDMGFSDIGCYGGEIETPSLDRLATNGLRFRQFYNGARCCPTRATLLTGVYAHQAGVGHMMTDRGLQGYRGDLNENCITIAQVLHRAGYATYMSGKWHVTKKIGPDLHPGDQRNWPRQRGFERFFGTIHGAGSFFDPNSLTRNNLLIAPPDDFFYTDAIADNAVQFIAEHDARRPFFMYVAFTAPHWPMHAKPTDMSKYRGRYADGWDAVRHRRLERMRSMGLIEEDWKLTERDPRAKPWDEVSDKAWNERRMEVYAAMVDCMDQGIGRIVDQLARSKQLDNTLLLFLADNGGCAEEYGSHEPAQERDLSPRESDDGPMQPGELQTRMRPQKTRDGRVVRVGRGVMPGDADTYIAYGKEWANASNTPFRLYKHYVHEGGISSPLIVHWPRGLSEQVVGNWENQPAHLIDLMATCVDTSGADYPAEWEGNAIVPMQGVSLAPSFTGDAWQRNQPLFWEHEGNRAVRDGKWKLVARGATGSWELYDMVADRTETNNVASKDPQRVLAMAKQWRDWAKSAHVLPWPWKPPSSP